jgi:hypothetical protein
MTKYICKQCKTGSEIPDCVTCGSWMCPDCKTMNDIVTAPEPGEDWLGGGLCTYNGPGSDLPTGGYCKIVKSGTPWGPELLAKSWTVADAETDAGVAEKKGKELTADDTIIGVTLNQNTIAAIVAQYGREFYKIKDANSNEMTLDQWQAKYGTNGLGLVAIRNMRTKLGGGGVHF